MEKNHNSIIDEILFGTIEKKGSAYISKLLKLGAIRKIAPRLYSSNFEEAPSIIIKRNWYKILANQYPDAILSHRSALEFRPTNNGDIYLTYTYNKNISLPGLTIHFQKGVGKISGDNAFFDQLFVSQEPRAFLENLQLARTTNGQSKVIDQMEIEDRLEKMIQIKGDQYINKLRDQAKVIAPIIGMDKEFKKLNQIISALLATGDSKKITSQLAKSRIGGLPYDKSRFELFEILYHSLVDKIYPDYFEKNISQSSYQNFAFYESYFSNYIEGTQFLIEEAKEIIANEMTIPSREDDSHDVLGTYQILSNKVEMGIVPKTVDHFLSLLKQRHAILLRSRISKQPGVFKDKNNRAGNTEFVDKDLVIGTLSKGFDLYRLLQNPFSKAAYMMFLISEVHPFLDGNGRIARVMMNAELTAAGYSKIIIPTVYREDYIGSLKQLSNMHLPEAYIRMLLRAWQFSANIFGDDRDQMEILLVNADAFKEPKYGKLNIN
jgi:hypothetical protein